MTTKGILTLCVAFALAIGIAIIAQDLGSAIESSSRSRSRAEQQKLDQQNAEWKLDQETREKLLPKQLALKGTILETLRYVLPIAILLVIAITLYLYHSWSKAEVKKALWQSTLIPLDPKTRQYPLIPFEANGRLRLHNPNTGQTVALDQESEMIPLLTQGSVAVQLQGLAQSGNSEAARVIDLLRLPMKKEIENVSR